VKSTHRYTVDASVFVNAFNPIEIGHAESNRLLAELKTQGLPIVVPTLVFPEIAATISRVLGDAALARTFANTLREWPGLVIVALDDALSRQAVEAAAQYRLRGSDAVYVAVALRFGCALVTLDQEQRRRAASAMVAQSPAEALANLA